MMPLHGGWWSSPREALVFEATSRCNLRCSHCYNIWKGAGTTDPCAELGTADAVALIEKLTRETRCRIFTFSGGEPLLRDDLETLIAAARRRCSHVVLITNGTLLDEARVRRLMAAGVSLFELPLLAPEAELHDRLAGGPAFRQVTRAAAEICCQGGQPAFAFVATAENIGRLREVLELGMALGARSFLLNRYNAGGAGRRNPAALLPSPQAYRAALAVADDFAARFGLAISASIASPACLIDPRLYPHVGFGYCSAGTPRAYYAIGPLGHVRPCNHSSRVLGNALHQRFRDIVRSTAMESFRRARPAFCGGCRLEMTCLGGCKAAAEVCCGSEWACEPFLELNRDEAQAGRLDAERDAAGAV